MKKSLAFSLLLLMLILPAVTEAQVSWSTGTVGFQLGAYGRVRFGAPLFGSTRHLDRASVVAALDQNNVFDYTEDANTVVAPAFINVPGIDTAATVVTDNSYSGLPPKVRARTTIWAWHNETYIIVRYTIYNDSTITLPLSLGTAVVPQPSNAYGNETCQYDSARQVAYYFRGVTPVFIGLKFLDGAPSSFHVRDWDVYSPDPDNDQASDSMRYAMTAPDGFDPPLTGGSDGVMLHFNGGLHSIPPGGSYTISYALVYAADVTTLLNEADSAQVKYDGILPTVVHDISLTGLQQQSAAFALDAPVTVRAAVRNYGAFVENSYQVGWEIDGVPQTSVSNSAPLAIGGADTLTLTWPVPTPGLHFVRAWTILGTDSVQANDSCVARGVFISQPYTIFEERFNGAFPPAGWTTINRDGGGTSGPWGQGSTGRFLSLEGPDNGFAGDSYTTAESLYIDDYLITPNTGTPPDPTGVDSLIFYARSYDSAYPDSLEIRVSTTGTDTADFTTLLDYINVPKTGWTRFAYQLPITATRYVAFRYLMYDGGASGSNSVYVGIDVPHILRYGATNASVSVPFGGGWNMLSEPVAAASDSVRPLFPQSIFDYGFGFSSAGGYQQSYLLEAGKGYWLKMSAAGLQPITGAVRNSIALPVTTGWNMIGSLSATIDTSAAHAATVPPGLRASHWFKYKTAPASGYDIATDIEPGSGYWVKMSGAGTLTLNVYGPAAAAQREPGNQLAGLNTITIADARGQSQTLYFGADPERKVSVAMYELPPPAPGGALDVRFGRGGMVETASGTDGGAFPILVGSAVYPVTVSWDVSCTGSFELSDAGTPPRVLSGRGSLVLTREPVGLMLRMEGGNALPEAFALAQNYPNPFNPLTTISFALPVAGRVHAEIYDLLGRQVTTLVNEQLPAGYHNRIWNGTGAAGTAVGSGTYFLKLTVAGDNGRFFSDIRKMVLLK